MVLIAYEEFSQVTNALNSMGPHDIPFPLATSRIQRERALWPLTVLRELYVNAEN